MRLVVFDAGDVKGNEGDSYHSIIRSQLLLKWIGNLYEDECMPCIITKSDVVLFCFYFVTELGIFRVISAFCDTPVSQNAEITQKNSSAANIDESGDGWGYNQRQLSTYCG